MPPPASLTEQFDTLYSTTWQLMRDEVVDNIFRATPLYFWLNSKGRVRRETGGRWIGVQLMYAKNTTVQTLGPGGIVDISPQDPMTTAKYDWRWIAGSVIRLYAEDHMNAGRSQIMNLVQGKLKNLELSLIDKMELMAYGDGTTNGGLDFDGLGNLVATTAGLTVGGINSTTQTWWDNYRKTYVAANGIRAEMTTAYNSVSVGNDHPTLILTTQSIYEMYETTLTNILRTTSNALGDAGFESLAFKGGAVTFSPSCTATNVYFLNERYLEMILESDADFAMTDWKPIPNQLDRVAQVVSQADIVTSNRRMQGVLTAVA
jgi:hypothetical protein